MFKQLITSALIILTFACHHTDNSTPAPASKTYGVFRTLKPKATPMVVGKVAAAVVSTNITPRNNHRAIQMLDGRVLLVGGDVYANNGPGIVNIPTMDIYSPSTESFTPSNSHPHATFIYQNGAGTYNYGSFALVNLPGGKVWIGGANGLNKDEAYSYDIYDPSTDTIVNVPVVTEIGSQDYPQVGPCEEAYYIGNNKIMLFLTVGSQAILDLTTSRVSWLINDANDIGHLTGISTIQDLSGNVYQIGGTVLAGDSINIPQATSFPAIFKFDVTTSTWSKKHDLQTAREQSNLVLLPNNKIGIYGGRRVLNGQTTNLKSVEIYDIDTDSVSSAIDLIGDRSKSASVYLQTGYTLIAGGLNGSNLPEDSELIHKSDFSGSTGLMTMKRTGHTVTSLPNGLVLIAGGFGSGESQTTAELFDPLAKLYLSYLSEQIVVGNTLQFTAKDSTGLTANVTWAVNNPSIATVTSTGLLTSLTEGNIEVTATLVTDPTVTAVVRIKILPQ